MTSDEYSRRDFLQRTAAVGAAASTGLGFSVPPRAPNYERHDPSDEAGQERGHALVTWGGWEGHEPEAFKNPIVPWLKEDGFNVTVANSLDPYADASLMGTVDVVIQQWTMGEIEDEQLDGLLTAVRNGTGVAGWHGGTVDSFRAWPRYLYMTGAQWAAHPGGQDVTYTVHITDEDDEIVAGIDDFEVTTEQYYMLVDPANKVLATTTFTGEHDAWLDGAVMPVIWKKRFGRGRVFVNALGHSTDVFENSERAFETVKRGIRWASRTKEVSDDLSNLVRSVYPRS